jgi:hypothetical protein
MNPIKRARAVKVKGQTEDIEIILDNGNVIYSQAKSVKEFDDTSNVIQKVKDSLRTLNALVIPRQSRGTSKV